MIPSIRAAIWSTSKHDPGVIEKAKQGVKIDPTTVHYWEAVLRRVEELMKPIKRKRKYPPISEVAKTRYRDAKWSWYDKNLRVIIDDGHFIEPGKFPDNSANGITNYIEDFLGWSGHFANRTGNEGRVIIKDGEPMRIPSASKNGMQDIDINLKHPAHPFGIPWKCEVKAEGDTVKKNQEKFGKKVSKTGGHYSVVRSVDDFLMQYDQLMVMQKDLFSS